MGCSRSGYDHEITRGESHRGGHHPRFPGDSCTAAVPPRVWRMKILNLRQALDIENKGYLTTEELRELMTKNEEHFSADEIGEMLAFAVDPDTGNCNFTEYAEKVANFAPLF